MTDFSIGPRLLVAGTRWLRDVSTILPAEIADLRLTGSAAIDGTGNALDNTLQGNDAANHLYGLAEIDVLRGYAGDDRLDGGTGADRLVGGAGNDTYIVDQVGDYALEQADEGWDMVRASISWRLGAHLEALRLTGSAAIDGTGNALDNTLQGNDAANHLYGLAGNDVLRGYGGDDWLDGGTGVDRMVGGAGNDTYVVSQAGDYALEKPDEGWDTVLAGLSWRLGAQLEALVLTGGGAIDGTGNALDNTIQGNDAANRLYGLAGDDRLYGLGGDDRLVGLTGDDWLDGGAGKDVLIGGLGNDTYWLDSFLDQVVERADEGYDTIIASDSAFMPKHVEALRLTGRGDLDGYGNELDNSIRGNAGRNLLWGYDGDDRLYGLDGDDALLGADGNDRMVGGAGNDGYAVDSAGDVLVEAANEGWDIAELVVADPTWSRYVLSAHVEEARLYPNTAAFTGFTLVGNAEDNRLIATLSTTGGIHLQGLAGDDYLAVNGYQPGQTAGRNQLSGGSGADTFSIFEIRERADAVADLPLINDFTPGEDRLELRAWQMQVPVDPDQWTEWGTVVEFAELGTITRSATGTASLTGHVLQLVLDTSTGAVTAYKESADAAGEASLAFIGNVAVLNPEAWDGFSATDVYLIWI